MFFKKELFVTTSTEQKSKVLEWRHRADLFIRSSSRKRNMRTRHIFYSRVTFKFINQYVIKKKNTTF